MQKTKETIEKVLKQNGVEAEVIKVEDIETILKYGVMVTPAVVVDGEVKLAGKIPDEKDIRRWIA
jgi:small redox-active disulfide protein 2